MKKAGDRPSRKGKSMVETESLRLAKPEEFETLKANIKTAFTAVGIEISEIATEPDGRMLAKADISPEDLEKVVAELFRYKLVIVPTPDGDWGFAVHK